ncbi:MAG: hypothetical protein O3B13_20540 [Planctomycetota bacterium]|nr:hypothetical protein [Planctomycetota bacterium]
MLTPDVSLVSGLVFVFSRNWKRIGCLHGRSPAYESNACGTQNRYFIEDKQRYHEHAAEISKGTAIQTTLDFVEFSNARRMSSEKEHGHEFVSNSIR